MSTGHATRQGAEERRDLETFLQGASLVAQRIDKGEDPPDFYVQVADRRIAIEHTNFYRRGEEQAALGCWRKLSGLIEPLRQEHPHLGKVSLTVNFKGRPGRVPPRVTHQALASELVMFVAGLQRLSSEIEEIATFPDTAPALQAHVDCVLVCRAPVAEGEWQWAGAIASFLGADEPDFRGAFEKKARAARPSNVSEFWLLVVTGLAMPQIVPDPDVLAEFESIDTILRGSAFDRGYFLEVAFGRLLTWDRVHGWAELPVGGAAEVQ